MIVLRWTRRSTHYLPSRSVLRLVVLRDVSQRFVLPQFLLPPRWHTTDELDRVGGIWWLNFGPGRKDFKGKGREL